MMLRVVLVLLSVVSACSLKWRQNESHATVSDGSQIQVSGGTLTLDQAIRRLGGSQNRVSGGSRQLDESKTLRGVTKGAPCASSITERGQSSLDIAFVYISGRNDYDAALHEAVLQYAPMGHVYHPPGGGAQPMNFIMALENATRTFPEASWYYLADDDSFAHVARVKKMASKYNAKQFHLVGHAECVGGTCQAAIDDPLKCQRKVLPAGIGIIPNSEHPGWPCGGGGVLVSRPLAEAVLAQECTKFYHNSGPDIQIHHGDMALSCCVFDAWKGYKIDNEPGLEPYNVDLDNSCWIASVHGISPAVTRELGKRFNKPK